MAGPDSPPCSETDPSHGVIPPIMAERPTSVPEQPKNLALRQHQAGSRLLDSPPSSPIRPHSDTSTLPSPSAGLEYLHSLKPPTADEFRRLSSIQSQREKEHRRRHRELLRRHREASHRAMEARRQFMHARAVGAGHEDADAARMRAAMVIQRSYRGYRVRREMNGLNLDAGTRWALTVRDAKWQDVNLPRPKSNRISFAESQQSEGEPKPSLARQNWAKAATVARRAGTDEDSIHEELSSSSCDERDLTQMDSHEKSAALARRQADKDKRRKHTQTMGLPYFLEMVDLKHRYGSNLRTYHEEWKRADTNENFFYWLDYGDGLQISLPTCPRERLDREQVRYLTREERQHYLVQVDSEGRLVWAKNGIRVDTTEAWKDSVKGIVPSDDPTPAFSPHTHQDPSSPPLDTEIPRSNIDHEPQPSQQHGLESSSSSSGSQHPTEAELEAAAAAKYANPAFDEAKGLKKVRRVSASAIMDRLLRKSVRKNTWIFVADASFRLYIGIKNSGAFQHSSFLHGARISAAGLIKAKEGRISSLSPLSGHYRPPMSNFRAFIKNLEERGADMSHVSVSKSYAVLVGLEAYTKARKKGKETVKRFSHKKLQVVRPELAAEKEKAEMDTSQSAAREREVIEAERAEREKGHRSEKRNSLYDRLKRRPGSSVDGQATETQGQ